MNGTSSDPITIGTARYHNIARRAILILALAAVPAHVAATVLSATYAVRTGSGWIHELVHGPLRPSTRRIVEEDGRRFLVAGSQRDEWFDVTEFRLNPRNLKYGIGRETFPALIKPKFDSAESTLTWLDDDDRVLAVRIGSNVKVYPIQLLEVHEAINDEIAGQPILATYCVLADLGAIYDRRVGEHTLTFGLSGYTCSDPSVWDGRSAFILWNRETESLWWPPLGKALSGDLIDVPLATIDEQHWSQTTWGEIRAAWPNAMVLQRGQTMTPPQNWPQLDGEALRQSLTTGSARIAPRWGENSSLEQ